MVHGLREGARGGRQEAEEEGIAISFEEFEEGEGEGEGQAAQQTSGPARGARAAFSPLIWYRVDEQ